MEHIEKSWLREKTTLKKVEKDNLVQLDELGPEPILFGNEHERWLQFKFQIRKGDELWEFGSLPPWPGDPDGYGLCIVRDGQIEDYFVIDCLDNYEPENGVFVCSGRETMPEEKS